MMAALVMCAGCEKDQDAGQEAEEQGSVEQNEPDEVEKDTDAEPAGDAEVETKTEETFEETTEAKDEPMQDKKEDEAADAPAADGKLYATFETSMGVMIIELFEDDAPETVKNFVGLATGTKTYKDPRTGEEKKGNFYDGLIFHRVIPRFMIQGGCPLGNGRGGPGYKFKDEFVGHLQFDKPGYLAMANSGPSTNGSQFFITVAPTPHLSNKHTIFGKVVDGYDKAEAISKVDTGQGSKPVVPVVIKRVTIEREKD
jgi:peptidyl-prolyl cis-trans isomerase A (cyclophilin A)